MNHLKRILSSVLLAGGLVLVFAGLSHALGFTFPGMLAAGAAIAALLYAGGVWFGGTPGSLAVAGGARVIVFDQELRVVAGGEPGASIGSAFPGPARADVTRHCREALRGGRARFTCEIEGRPVPFETAPVTAASGEVLYGVLMAGTAQAAPQFVPAAIS